jgi:vacuolar protein sorting-associated protein 35
VISVFIQAANDCDLEPVAYEFFTQAFILYEEEIAVCPSPALFPMCVLVYATLFQYMNCLTPSIHCLCIMFYFFCIIFLCHTQDSKAQITAIHLIIGTLHRMNIFGVENRDTLTHKTTGVTISFNLSFQTLFHVIWNQFSSDPMLASSQ